MSWFWQPIPPAAAQPSEAATPQPPIMVRRTAGDTPLRGVTAEYSVRGTAEFPAESFEAHRFFQVM